MRKHILLFLLIALAPFFASAQKSIDSTKLKRSAEAEAQKMLKCLINKKYESFVNYMYTLIVEGGGGKVNMTLTIKNSISDMEKSGGGIESVTIGSAGRIYRKGKELQCLVPDICYIKNEGKIMKAKSHLIAVSIDEGKTWTFIDVSYFQDPEVKAHFTNLSEEMIIPLFEQPEYLSK